MSMFDQEDGKLLPFTTLERMISALSISFSEKQISLAGSKFTAKIKDIQNRTITPSINFKSGEFVCSCEDFHYRKLLCKHVIGLLFYLKLKHHEKYESFLTALGNPQFIKYATPDPTGFLSFQVKGLDELTKGGLPLSIVTGFVGDPRIGKTWLAYQTSVSCNLPKEMGGLGKPALYVNLEADFLKPGVKERFQDYFKTRFKKEFRIDFLFPRSIFSLFELFGLGLDLKKTEKRVMPSIWDETPPLESPIAQIQRRVKYGLIIVDSLTSVFKKEISVPPNQNISSRAACMNSIWGRFENIVENFGIAMVVTHHCTKDPINPKTFGDPYGGDTIMYNMKHVLHLLHGTKDIFEKYGSGGRRILRARWPGLMPTQIPANLAQNTGFVDVS